RGNNLAVRGQKSGTFAISGDYPQIKPIQGLLKTQGRFIKERDLYEKRKVAVIGRRVVELLFDPDEDPIGEYIRVSGVLFQVVGVFQMQADGDKAQEAEAHIYLPFTTFNRAFNFGNTVSWLAITSQPNVPASQVEDQALSILKSRHQVNPEDERAFGHWNQERQFMRIKNVFIGIRFISWVVGILTLLAGAIGISNIMLVVVKERTREIGVRRALGAKPWQIMRQIILESVTLTLVAGYGGMIFGLGLLELIAWTMESFQMDTGMFGSPYIQVELAVVALVILIISGIFAGAIPANRAIRIRPVDALRAE
ncbi:MAG: FtsX-like permease family protein, partial [Bacteroidota bacterium]